AGETAGDCLAGVLARLQRDGAELRQHLPGLRVRDCRDVAHREELVPAGNVELGPDPDPVAALELEAERADELVAAQPGSPHERVGLQLLSTGKRDARRRD